MVVGQEKLDDRKGRRVSQLENTYDAVPHKGATPPYPRPRSISQTIIFIILTNDDHVLLRAHTRPQTDLRLQTRPLHRPHSSRPHYGHQIHLKLSQRKCNLPLANPLHPPPLPPRLLLLLHPPLHRPTTPRHPHTLLLLPVRQTRLRPPNPVRSHAPRRGRQDGAMGGPEGGGVWREGRGGYVSAFV